MSQHWKLSREGNRGKATGCSRRSGLASTSSRQCEWSKVCNARCALL
jgi:hypothetical protein